MASISSEFFLSSLEFTKTQVKEPSKTLGSMVFGTAEVAMASLMLAAVGGQ